MHDGVLFYSSAGSMSSCWASAEAHGLRRSLEWPDRWPDRQKTMRDAGILASESSALIVESGRQVFGNQRLLLLSMNSASSLQEQVILLTSIAQEVVPD